MIKRRDPAGACELFEPLEARRVLATATVTSTADSGAGSLRQAIVDTNLAPGADVIVFHPSLQSQTITMGGSEMVIADHLTIKGLGANVLTLNAAGSSRAFVISSGIACTISGLTISGGNTGGSGGAILNSAAQLTLDSVAITGSVASQSGGGVANLSGELRIFNSTISDNSSNDGGGGAYSNEHATLTIRNSTLSGNFALGGGGVHNSGGTLRITNSTITDNDAGLFGGGILTTGPNASIESTIVAGNFSAGGDDIKGDPLKPSSANNLVGDTASAGGLINAVNGNIVGLDPRLEPLGAWGGPTHTHALKPISPGVDTGSNPLTLTNDQRGPGFPRARGTRIDIGAFEFDPDDHANADQWAAAANVVVNPNSGDGSVTGEIGNNRDTDLFRLTTAGTGDATLMLDVAPDFDGWFEIYTSTHSFLTRRNVKGAGGDEMHTGSVGANATYFILVGGWRSPGGTFTLTLNGPPAPDDHPDAGAWSNAGSIPIGPNSGDGSRSGQIEAAGDTDLFRLTAPRSGPITISLDVVAGFDGWLEIYDAGHNLVGTRRNTGGPGSDETFTFTGAAGQPYFVLVGGWRNPAGAYTLHVNA